ncbi:MAG: SURF1 family protein [Pseudomonadota bacterium]
MRIPVWATLFTALGVLILISLGTWQVQRLNWKNDIIAKLDSAYAGQDDQVLDLNAAENSDFAYGRLSGKFLPNKAIALGPKTHDGKVGYHVLAPMNIDGARDVIVNLGWANQPFETLPLFEIPKNMTVEVSGLTRKPEWNSFTSANSPERELWFRADIAEIAEAKNLNNTYPFILYAEHISENAQNVLMESQRWYPRNKHFQYALFWYAMAGALIGVYFLRFIRKN